MEAQLENKNNNGSNGMRKTAEKLTAIIDIGSNSVRLVVFQGLHRNPQVLFNERVLCGLGRDVKIRGVMDDEAVHMAQQTLLRFAELCSDMAVDHIEAVATAAVRDSDNGQEFVDWVFANCGFEVRIISGKQEAKYSAMGVLSGIPNAHGLVGDLGGGSLELITLNKGSIGEGVTLPIGPLSLIGNTEDYSNKVMKKIIQEALDRVDWIDCMEGEAFYMVGGAWRTICQMHMAREKWPLPVVQQYEIGAEKMKKYCKSISKTSLKKLLSRPFISSRRAETIPLAAVILREVIKRAKPKKIVASAQGIREGILYKKMSDVMKKTDPFLAVCKEWADATGRFPEHADKLMAFIDPLFGHESKRERRLRYAVCLLSDIAWKAHPDFRAETAFNSVFVGHFGGISHKERAFVSLALSILFGGAVGDSFSNGAASLLSKPEVLYAMQIGHALRLGQRLTGGTSIPLEFTTINNTEGNHITLTIPENHKTLVGEIVLNRLGALANTFNLDYVVRYSEAN